MTNKHDNIDNGLDQKKCVRRSCKGTMIPVLGLHPANYYTRPLNTDVRAEWECYKCHKVISRIDKSWDKKIELFTQIAKDRIKRREESKPKNKGRNRNRQGK